MVNSHVAQHFPAVWSTGRGEDLGIGGPGDRDRRLAHPTSGRVDEHLVAGFDAGQVVQAVPGGGRRSGDRGGVAPAQPGWQRCRQRGVAGEIGRPAASEGHPADTFADLKVSDVGSHRGHHSGEIQSELRLLSVEGWVAAESRQHVGEVDAGCPHRNLDLSGSGPNAGGLEAFDRLWIPWGAHVQAHTVAMVVDHCAHPLVGPQRCRAQARREPPIVAPGGLVFGRGGQELPCDFVRSGQGVDVDVGGPQVGMLGADRP